MRRTPSSIAGINELQSLCHCQATGLGCVKPYCGATMAYVLCVYSQDELSQLGMWITSSQGPVVAVTTMTIFNPCAEPAIGLRHSERGGAKKFMAPIRKTARVD